MSGEQFLVGRVVAVRCGGCTWTGTTERLYSATRTANSAWYRVVLSARIPAQGASSRTIRVVKGPTQQQKRTIWFAT